MRAAVCSAAFAVSSVLLLPSSVTAGGTSTFNPNSVLYIDASVVQNGPVNAAVADFQRDWYKVIGTTLSITTVPIAAWDGGCVLSLYVDNATYAPESFLVESVNSGIYPELRITAADMRGLIYGIYQVSGDFLGVDPFWWQYDLQPAFAGSVDVPTNYFYFSEAPAFTARGAFFNDEDLLGFFYQDQLGESVYDTRTASFFAETILRLRLNTVIPSTFAFPDERHYRVMSARGLRLGNHHVMPVNLNVFAWPKGVSYSYRQNPETFHALWSSLIEYEQNTDAREMVYSVGLRGVNDEPFWNEDIYCNTVQCQGATISAAIANQTQIALATPTANGAPPQIVSYLWMELQGLIEAGTLHFPPGVTVVITDFPGSFNIIADNATATSGLYVHLQMMNGQGGQITEFIPMRRAFNGLYCFYEKNATSYAMINLSDLRPVPLGSEAAYRYLWNPNDFNGTAIRALSAGGHKRKSGGHRKGRRGPVNWWPSAKNPATWGGQAEMEAAFGAEAGPVTPAEAEAAFHLEFAMRHYGGASNSSVPQIVADIYTAYFNMSFLAPDGINTRGDHYFGNTLRGLLGPFESAVDAGSRPSSLSQAAAPLLSFAESNLPYVSDLFLNQVIPTASLIAPGQQSAFYAAHVVAQTAVYFCHLQAFKYTALGADAWVAGDNTAALGNVTLALSAMDELLMYLREGEGQGVWRGVFQFDRWTWSTGSRATLSHLALHIQGLHGPSPGPDPYTDYAIMTYEGQPNDPLGIAGRSFPFSTFNQSNIALDVAVRVYCQDDAPAPYNSNPAAPSAAAAPSSSSSSSSADSCSTNWVGVTFSGASANVVLFTAPHPLRTPFTPPSIHYTLDGTSPTISSPAYTGTPIVVTANATLTARAFEAGTNTPLAFDNVATIIQK